MSLLSIILMLVCVGFLTWLVLTFIPMPASFHSAIIGIVGIFLLFWILQQLGVLSGNFFRLR